MGVRLVGLAALFLLALTQPGSAQNRPVGPAPGRIVDVGGRSLHIRCVGPATGGATVVLEAGAGDYSNRWTAVQELLAPRIRSCAYDRAGFGWSAGNPQNAALDNADLRALLATTNVPGPYVLVGHSLGALLVRRYADQYPEGIVGMVLVGPTHENTRLFNVAQKQWVRMREVPAFGADFQERYLARQANPVPLGDRPLIVVVGTRPDPQVNTPAEIADDKAAETHDHPRLSRNSKLVTDPQSGHHIHVDNPRLVADAIEEVVIAATNGTSIR
jgi:pimeloyl-ACP methyl ester carboxylesterase